MIRNVLVTRDAFLDSTNPNNNYGDYASWRWLYNTYGYYATAFGIDLSRYKGEVNQARIYYYIYIRSSYTCSLAMYPFASDWDEMTITWNNKPSVGSSVATDSITATGWKYSTLPNSLVQGWIDDPDSNYGIYTVQTNSTGGSSYYVNARSRESEEGNLPYLELDYNPKSAGFFAFFCESWQRRNKLWRNNKLILPKDLGFSY